MRKRFRGLAGGGRARATCGVALYDPPGKLVLAHSPLGLRVEFNADRDGALNLWFSPRARTSAAFHDRNFSNRDDPSPVFEEISLPGLGEAAFESCAYDPFHTVLRFRKQTVHLAACADEPAVYLWFEDAQNVDLKSGREASPLETARTVFAVARPERGEVLEHAAAVAGAGSRFRHQRTRAAGRSVYARAELAAGGRIVLAAGLEGEHTAALARRLARQTPEARLRASERAVAERLRDGGFRLADPELQGLLDLNRRVLAAMEDAQGAIRAAINRIYYMIWVRDGGMIQVAQAASGNAAPLERWCRFLLANPTRVARGPHRGILFGQLVGPLAKWQEDGLFHAVNAVYQRWTSTGARPTAAERRTLLAAADWLDRYCFDRRRGLYGRYYACETPLHRSHDAGYDEATGKPVDFWTPSWNGAKPVRSYDLYVNQYGYALARMLETLLPGAAARHWGERAERLAAAMRPWFGDGMPDYGDLVLENGTVVRAPAYGLDRCDYEWACSVPPFFSEPERLPGILAGLLRRMEAEPRTVFLASWFSLLAACDPLDVPEETLLRLARYAAAQCARGGAKLAMPGAVVECLDVPDGDLYHDVRPQAFSIGPWLAAAVALGVRRLPLGLAVRGTAQLLEAGPYVFGGMRVRFAFAGAGPWADVRVDGAPLAHTLQIPEARLHDGARIEVAGRPDAPAGPLLTASSARLHNVDTDDGAVVYSLEARGDTWLRFAPGVRGLAVADASGARLVETPEGVWLRFRAAGRCSVRAASV